MNRASEKRRAKRAGILPVVVESGPLRLAGTVEKLNRPPLPGDALRIYDLGNAYRLSNGNEVVSERELTRLLELSPEAFAAMFEGCPRVRYRLTDGAEVVGILTKLFEVALNTPPSQRRAPAAWAIYGLIDAIDRRRAA